MRARIFGTQRKARFGRRARSVAVTAVGAGALELMRRLVRRGGERQGRDSMTEENKRIARRAIEEIYNAGKLEVVDELLAPECVSYDVAMPEPLRGRDALKQQAQGYRSAFPDLRLTIDQQLAELRDGRIVESRTNWDALGLMQQLGAISMPSPAEAQA